MNATKIIGIFIGAIGASLLAILSNSTGGGTLLGDILAYQRFELCRLSHLS
ncbi:MAG: hypothetical protein R2779_10520 [Crocinitomicaceae bacterium]